MSTTDSARTDDPMNQIARLREQVETLLREKVCPAIDNAADHLEASAHDASILLRDKAEVLSGAVRTQPLTAILIAAAAGFILGRACR